MERRTFITTISSALLVPLLKIDQSYDLHGLLQNFTDKDVYQRYDLTRPYVVNNFAYASDARIMARIPSRFGDESDEQIKKPDFDGVYQAFWKDGDFKPFRLPDPNDCVWSQSRCWKCDSRRVDATAFVATKPDEYDQIVKDYDPDNNTILDDSCDVCHGETHSNSGRTVEFSNGLRFDYYYMKKIAKIPGVEIAMEVIEHRKGVVLDQKPILRFKSDIGISGVVLGVVKV